MKFPEQFRYKSPGTDYESNEGDPFGLFMIPPQKIGPKMISRTLQVMAAVESPDKGLEWQYANVSLPKHRLKNPSWEEMQLVKSLFWEPNEVVVQFHAPSRDRMPELPGCLRLWKPTGLEMPTPPTIHV